MTDPNNTPPKKARMDDDDSAFLAPPPPTPKTDKKSKRTKLFLCTPCRTQYSRKDGLERHSDTGTKYIELFLFLK
jgi:hypothetical protein